MRIPRNQGFIPKEEGTKDTEREEEIHTSNIQKNADNKDTLQCAEMIANQQGLNLEESNEQVLKDKVESVSLHPTQIGEPAISIRTPKESGFIPDNKLAQNIGPSEDRPDKLNFSIEKLHSGTKNLSEQISKNLGEHSEIEYTKDFENKISILTPVTEQASHEQVNVPICKEKCEGYEPLRESAVQKGKMFNDQMEFASPHSVKTSEKQVLKCIEKVVGHGDGGQGIFNIPKLPSDSYVANEKCESLPSKACRIGCAEGFVPMNEQTEQLLENESLLGRASTLDEVSLCRVLKTDSIQGYAAKPEGISNFPVEESLMSPAKLVKEEISANFGDQVVNQVSNITGHGEGHGLAVSIKTEQSKHQNVNEKSVSPPGEAHNVEKYAGFLPIQENTKMLYENETQMQKADIPARAMQTENMQCFIQSSYQTSEGENTEKIAPMLTESAKLASSESIAHEVARCVDKITGHAEGHGLIVNLNQKQKIHTASEKCDSPPGEAATIGKYEGYVPIQGVTESLPVSDKPSVTANLQPSDLLNTAVKKECHQGFLYMPDSLAEISNTTQASRASASVTSPTLDIGQVLQTGFLPLQERVNEPLEKTPLILEDVHTLKEKPTPQMIAASQSLTGGIAPSQEEIGDLKLPKQDYARFSKSDYTTVTYNQHEEGFQPKTTSAQETNLLPFDTKAVAMPTFDDVQREVGNLIGIVQGVRCSKYQ